MVPPIMFQPAERFRVNESTGSPVNPEQTKFQAEAGERVKEGQVIGEVVNLFGDTLQMVTAPYDGVANSSRTSMVANEGDTLINVVKV